VTGRPRCPACGLPMIGDLCIGCNKEAALCAPPCPVKAAEATADAVAAVLGVGGSAGTSGVVSEAIDDGQVSHTSNSALSKNSPLASESNTSNTSNSGLEYDVRDGAWLDGRQFPPLAYNVPGLLPAGFGIIAAPPKGGKSLLILDWLLAAAIGGVALGKLRVGPARDVLYLALEDGDRRLQERCRKLLGDGYPIPARFRYILTVPPGEVLAVLRDALDRHPDTRLIVLDTLGRIMPLPLQGETTYQRDYRVAVALKRIADERPGLTIIVIHHSRKASADDFIDSVSGTHGLAGAADTIIMLERRRGKEEGILRVTGRDVIEADYAVKFRGGAWSLDGADLDEARANVRRRAEIGALGDRSAEIIDFIRRQPKGVRAKGVREKFGADADMYLKRLLESGRLARPERGLYMVSEVSEVSDSQVSGPEESNTLPGLSETGEQASQQGQAPEPGATWPEGTLGAEANSDDEEDHDDRG
jgi:hypothetical protein